MDDIQYHIIQQRLLVKANILNAFECNDDEIQKSPAYTSTKPLHLYTGIHISKNGKKIYEYDKDKAVKRIEGKIDYPKKKVKNKKMEVTVDRVGKNILQYSKAKVDNFMELVHKKYRIDKNKIKYKKAKTTTSQYVRFKCKENRYVVRFSDHTYKIPKGENKILLNCYYDKDDQSFNIEASISKYSPSEIIKVIDSLEKASRYFNSEMNKEQIKKFVLNNRDEVKTDDYDDYDMYPYEVGMDLAGLYMKENNLSDNKYNSNFISLSKIMGEELVRLNIEENE